MSFPNSWKAITHAILATIACTLPSGTWASRAQGQDKKREQQQAADYKVLEGKRGSYVVKMLDNTETYSQAVAINAVGAIIGQREVANADNTIFRTEYFFFDGEQYKTMPLLEGYTNVESIALSDNNLVVGYASRVVGHPDGSLIAVAWEPLTDRIVALPRPEGDIGTHAQGISADGRRISGYASGPERMRPVVWSLGDDGQWSVAVLPTVMDQNPYIMSARTLVSPNGKLVASCCTIDISNGVYDSDLFVWREQEGEWEREHITDTQFYLRGINDSGAVVGSLSTQRGKRLPCVLDTSDKQVKPIALLAGDVAGEALAINSEGVVVGFSDDPSGPDGGPKPFIWRDGKTTAIDFGDTVYGAAHSITDAGQIAGYLDEPVNADDDADGGRVLAFWTVKEESAK